MQNKIKFPLVIVFTYLWIGFVCAESFVEAILKFQVPGITPPISLGLELFVLGLMNKMEWIFAVIIVISILPFTSISEHNNNNNNKEKTGYGTFLLFLLPLSILIIQSIWLLPAWEERADMIIKGSTNPSSNINFYFVAECLKLFSLFSFGLTQFV